MGVACKASPPHTVAVVRDVAYGFDVGSDRRLHGPIHHRRQQTEHRSSAVTRGCCPSKKGLLPGPWPRCIRGVSRKPTSIKLLSKVGAQHRENQRPDQRRHVGQHALADISRTSRMLKKLPLQHLMEMLLERPPPRETDRLLARCSTRRPSRPRTAWTRALDHELGVAHQFAIELDPRVLAFRSLSRVVFNHLFVWDSGQLKPSEQLDREWSCRGQPPSRARR